MIVSAYTSALIRYAARVPAVQGIVYESHPEGKYSEEGALGAHAEHQGAQFALNALRILPPRQPQESWEEYNRQADQVRNHFMAGARKHINENPNDALTTYYTNTANEFRTPEAGGKVPIRSGKRIELSDPGTLGISHLGTALQPLFQHLAVKWGLKKPRPVRPLLPPEPEHGDLPDSPDVSHYFDLGMPHTPEEAERHANSVLAAVDDEMLPYAEDMQEDETPHVHELEDLPEFDFGERPVPSHIQEIERSRRPAQRHDYPAIRQTISDVAANGTLGFTKRAIHELQKRYGLTPEQAERQVENWKSLRQKPEGKRTDQPEPTGRLPKKGGIRRRKSFERLADEVIQLAAYRAPAGGIIARGLNYKGGKFMPDMQGDFMTGRKKKGKSKMKPLVVSYARAMNGVVNLPL